jgi:hypothetical protein
MTEIAYEMLWDCKFCGQKKLLGLSHRHCPSCGAPQNAEERYFPSDAEKVRAEDHEYAGADLVCAHCGNANGQKANNCGGCGAPLEGGKEILRRSEQVQEQGAVFAGQSREDARRERMQRAGPHAARAPEKLPRARLFVRLGCATVLVLLGLVAVLLLWKKEGALTVTGHSWRREIAIEVYGPVSDSSWCDSLPMAARGMRRTSEVRSHRRVPDGQDCRTHKVDRGNGTFMEKEECSPRYRDEPVYGDKCYYVVDRWSVARRVDASGTSVTDPPRWPDTGMLRAGTCGGCERPGARKETYTVELMDAKAGKQTCDFDQSKWASFRDGTGFKGQLRVMNGSLDCATLTAN